VEPKIKRFIRLSGVGASIPCWLHNNSLHNVLVGLNERVFGVEDGAGGLKSPPQPHAGVFQLLRPFRAGVLSRLGSCNPWTTEEFLNSYTGSKRKRMEDAIESLARWPLTMRDAMLLAFVKAECIFKFLAAPRIIQPRFPRFNAAIGPFIKALEHKIYAAIAGYRKHPCVMKGYSAAGVANVIVGMWQKFRCPVAVGIDMSRFDQHVSVEALQFEHTFYTSAYPTHRKKLKQWLRWQVQNRGVAYTPEGVVRYRVDGKRMSGDMNTALGNCILMCGMVDAWLKDRNIDAQFVNNGDDVVVILEKGDLPRFMQGMDGFFLKFGFTAVVEDPEYELERVRFCQCSPIYDGTSWVMVREPLKAMVKDATCKSPSLGHNVLSGTRVWAGAVGLAGASLAGGIPLYNASYAYYQSLGIYGKGVQGFGDMSTGFEFMARGMTRNIREVSAEARFSFWKAFGILPDAQIAIEQQILSLGCPTACSQLISSCDYLGIAPSLLS
jgi:hypothetical protein